MSGQGTVTVRVQGPARYLSDNSREHWSVRYPLVRAWREASYIAHHNLLVRRAWAPCERARLDVVVIWPDRIHRDVDNHRATVKAAVDGAVRGRGKHKGAGMLPDDSAQHLPSPRLVAVVVPRADPALILTWTPLDTP